MAASSIRAVRWGAGTEFGLPSRGMPVYGHDRWQWLGIGASVEVGAAAPREFRVVDGLVAAVGHMGSNPGEGRHVGWPIHPAFFPDEHPGCLCPAPILGFMLPLVEGFAEFFCLELEYSDLLGVDRAVLTKLIGLDLQHLGLVADLPGLASQQPVLAAPYPGAKAVG
jgi:hypothetical protein